MEKDTDGQSKGRRMEQRETERSKGEGFNGERRKDQRGKERTEKDGRSKGRMMEQRKTDRAKREKGKEKNIWRKWRRMK
jgi:hypothetical protein